MARAPAAAGRPASPSRGGASPGEATGVFASVAIPFKALPSSASWNAVYPSIAEPAFSRCAASGTCPARAAHVARLVERLQGQSFSQKLAAVNLAVNQAISYTPDKENYGTLDHWAKPEQILARGRGDCEDYAILKMAALNAAGVPLASMSVVVLQDQRRRLFHAVLAVSTSKGHYILDNLSDAVVADTALPDYLPLYSMSGGRSWIHGKKRGDRLVATLGRLPANPSPGEGISGAATADPAPGRGGAPAAGR
ncbi:transglutaminase-like cysteine peptidase [Nitratireductor sp. ZSWI3]|uniref:transglutaminase-like cysteine peptidase n=1 Tax=Nitratireductor sp. ZSWI3 TaxID=2966359 RepID=UPI00214FAE20|nr:transglutaminase-like cysteine peptidase [Nitratireductor sp. ZSWI3]MCR4268620.1 transglutaminase-like cysteine peptidase [Nitratireductor sp. ZSWI3]